MLAAGSCWTDVCDHSCLAVASERVFQDLCQFAASEGCMLLFEIEGTNALFQCQERFIDFSSIHSCLAVLVHGVGASFTTRQINEAHLTVMSIWLTVRAQTQLENGMGA